MAVKLSAKDRATLERIVNATRGPAQCGTAKAADVKKLVSAGFVECGGDVEGTDEIYVRASQIGLDEFPIIANVEPVNMTQTDLDNFEGCKIMSDVSTETVETAPVAAKRAHVMVDPSTISVGAGLPPAAGKRGGGGGRKGVYPFATLAAPVRDAEGNALSMSFFMVPASEGRDDPARSLNATVSGHNKKAAAGPIDPATGLVPAFKVFAVEEAGVKCAKVFRVQ